MLTAALFTLVSAAAMTTDNGSVYSQKANASGTVLSGPDTIYLGKNCDALVKDGPSGSWSFNANGTFVFLGRATVFFPGQVPDAAPAACGD
ncbi:MAG: hypothetical protein AAGM84_04865 [Pseudomonadota bacterium]